MFSKPQRQEKANKKRQEKVYKRVLFLPPTESEIHIVIDAPNVTLSSLIFSEGLHKSGTIFDARKTFSSDTASVFVIIKYTGRKNIQSFKQFDAVVPLLYALPYHFARGEGFELFVMRYQGFSALAITFEGSLIYFADITSSLSDLSSLGAIVKEHLNNLSQYGINVVVSSSYYLHQEQDPIPPIEVLDPKIFINFTPVPYDEKSIVYKDVLNFIKPFIGSIRESNKIGDIIKYFIYGAGSISKQQKETVEVGVKFATLIVLIFLISKIFSIGHVFIQDRMTLLQQDSVAVAQKLDSLQKQKEQLSNYLTLSSAYKARQIESRDFEPIIKVATSGVSYQTLSISNEGQFSVSVEFNSPQQLNVYINKLMNSGYFASLDAPSKTKQKNVYQITGRLQK
jgi:hypothetical protein